MHVHDEITHVRIIDGLLCFGFPRTLSGFKIWVDADNIELVEIAKLNTAQFLQLAAKDEMKQLLLI